MLLESPYVQQCKWPQSYPSNWVCSSKIYVGNVDKSLQLLTIGCFCLDLPRPAGPYYERRRGPCQGWEALNLWPLQNWSWFQSQWRHDRGRHLSLAFSLSLPPSPFSFSYASLCFPSPPNIGVGTLRRKLIVYLTCGARYVAAPWYRVAYIILIFMADEE